MNKLRKVAAYSALTVAGGAGLGLAERVADPFERLEKSVSVEDASGSADMPFITAKYSLDGERHNDAPGDVMLVLMISGMAVAAALGVTDPSRPNPVRRMPIPEQVPETYIDLPEAA